MIYLKLQALSYGHSGVQLATVNRLIDFYNNDIIPVIYTQGSLGASGDLSPLAHLSLPLIGLGKVYYKGEIISSEELLKVFSWDKISLQSKEGLALLKRNTIYVGLREFIVCLKAHKLSYLADLIGYYFFRGF
ncbi:aromatic amino acid lyase [Polaribacter sp. Hel1_33_96]|uniref:aromatic amino acid lyase n=1 Tax=Polaribacter sp. Hel1_33_96 TaxID=1336805 RepID=UPI0020C7AFAF|nr:aromatic amino acid lyase [Polaribacter sp. Hel1_33_96]